MDIMMNAEQHENLKLENSELIIRHYGLLDPLDWAEDCENELNRMDLLWNQLVDLHEKYVGLYYATISKDSNLSSLKIRHDRLNSERAQATELNAAKKLLAIRQKELSREMAPELKDLELKRRLEVKEARQNSGLWWGNYNAIIRAFESARNAALRNGSSLRKRTEGGNGRITNTLQGGAAVVDLYDGSSTQVSIRMPDDGAWSAKCRGTRKHLQRTTLTATVFVKAGERRTVTWPFVMHRPIPLDARIKNVVITRRKIGRRWKWAASFTCRRNVGYNTHKLAGNNLAIDIGWRLVPEGLRVATILDSNYNLSFVTLPQDLLDSFLFVDDLRMQVDRCARTGLDLLSQIDVEKLMTPFHEHLIVFRNIKEKKISRLHDFVHSEFFTDQLADHIGPEILIWRSTYLKLTIWLRNHQRKITGRRNHLYHNAIAGILQDVTGVVLNDIKIGELVKSHELVKTRDFFPRRAHHYRNIAAPSIFVKILTHQTYKRYISLKKFNIGSPIPCPKCMSTLRSTRSDVLFQICGSCGFRFDVDIGVCEMLLGASNKSGGRVEMR